MLLQGVMVEPGVGEPRSSPVPRDPRPSPVPLKGQDPGLLKTECAEGVKHVDRISKGSGLYLKTES